MARTQVWDSSYENIPADNDQASEGALRIRNLKRDIRERAEIDHDWDDINDSGKHLKITFRDPLGAKPTAAASEGYLYTKDISAKAELFWEDEDGSEVQLTLGGEFNPNVAGFPATTSMVFRQTAAPTGWTKVTSGVDDKGLRVVTGTVGSGGTDVFSTVFDSAKATDAHQLTVAEMPAHTHTAGASAGALGGAVTFRTTVATGLATGSTGGDGTHTHTIVQDLQFEDVIFATKD